MQFAQRPEDASSPSDSSLNESASGSIPTVLNGKPRPVWNQVPERLGDYQVGPEIGRGGMGVIYEAIELGLNRRVALKVLPLNASSRMSSKQRFINEAIAAAQLDHDNIVPVYKRGEEAGTHYFAMKLIDGCDLGKVIRRARKSLQANHFQLDGDNPQADAQAQPVDRAADTQADKRSGSTLELTGADFSDSLKRNGYRSALKIAQTVSLIGQQVAEALEHSHQCGIIHRDIKPSNILLDADGKVWVTDFGLAHFPGAPDLTQSGEVVGSCRYMSPEQASGRRKFLDHRTDIYSLGVSLYELATLHTACRGESQRDIMRELTLERPVPIRKINPRLPRDFETIICKATERNPNDRYQSSKELADDLHRFLNNQSISTRRTGRWRYLRDWLYERPVLVAFTTLMLMIVLAVSGTYARALYSRGVSSESGRLRAEAAEKKVNDPGGAVWDAIHSAQMMPGFESDRAILATLNGLYEAKRIDIGNTEPGPLVFSRDGDLLLKCIANKWFHSQRGQAVIFNPDTGKELGRLKHSQPITMGAFSPNGQVLLTGGTSYPFATGGNMSLPFDQRYGFAPIAVWKPRDLSKSALLLPTARAVRLNEQIFSTTQPRVVLPATDAHEAIVFQMDDWSEMRLRGSHTAPVIQAIYAPDGKWIATWSEDQTIVLWDAVELKALRTMKYKSGSVPAYTSIAFSPDSKSLMIQGLGGTQLYEVEKDEPPEFHLDIYAKFSNSDSRFMLKNLPDRSVEILRAPSAKHIVANSTTKIADLAWQDNGQLIAGIAEQYHAIELFNAWDGSLTSILRGHSEWIADLQARPRSQQFATVAWDNTIRLWNSKSNAELLRMSLKEELRYPAMSLSPDEQQVVASSVLADRSILLPFTGNDERRTAAPGVINAISRAGVLFMAVEDKLVLLEGATGRRLQEFVLPNDKLAFVTLIEGAATGQAGDAMLITQGGGLLKLDAARNKLTKLSGDEHSVVTIVCHPTESWGLAGTLNGKLLRFDYGQGTIEEVASFNSCILDLDLDADGKRALVATLDHRLVVWNCEKRQSVQTIQGDATQIREAWFTFDGTQAISHGGFESTTACLWNLADGTLGSSVEAKYVNWAEPSSDRKSFAFATQHNGAFLWDIATSNQQPITDVPCSCVHFVGHKLLVSTSPPVEALYGVSQTKSRVAQVANLIQWDPAAKKVDSERLIGFNATALHFDQVSQQIIASGKSYGAVVFEIDSSSLKAELFGHTDELLAAGFLADGHSVITVARDGLVLLHDLRNRSQRLLGSHGYTLSAASISPDRTQLITADTSGTTTQWDLNQLVQVDAQAMVKDGVFVRLLFSSNSATVAGLTSQGEVQWWDLRTKQPKKLKTPEGIWQIAMSHKGDKLLGIRGNQPIVVKPSRMMDDATTDESKIDGKIIDLATGKIQELRIEGDIVNAQFLPADGMIALLNDRGNIFIYNLESFTVIHQFTTSPRVAGLLPVAATDRVLFAVGSGNVYGWNWQTGKQVADVELSKLSSSAMPHTWSVCPKSGEWWLLNDPRGIAKFPTHALEFAQKVAP